MSLNPENQKDALEKAGIQTRTIRDCYEILVDTKGNSGHWWVVITAGKYSGIIFRYISFSLPKNAEDDDICRFTYQHEILEPLPEKFHGVAVESLNNDLAYKNLLAAILIDILTKYYEDTDEQKDGNSEADIKNGRNDSETLDKQQ